MAQTQDVIRATVQSPRCKAFPARTNVVFYRGAIVCKRVGSELAEIPDPSNPRTDLIPLGIAKYQLDMTGVTSGTEVVVVEAGIKRDFKTGSSSNEITADHVGQTWYMYDDETAYLTDNGGTLSAGGTIALVDEDEYNSETNVALHFDFEQMQVLHAIKSLSQSLVLDTATELTIASGAVAVTQSHHTIDTESDAASDNLDTITGMVAGQFYAFKPANAARTVVIRDASVGGGNIRTPFAQSISLAEDDDYVLAISDGTDVTVVGFRTLAANGGGAGAIIGLLSALSTTDKASVVAAINEAFDFAVAAPAMQAVDATLVAGTVTIAAGITVAADSEVIPVLIGALTGSTNFGSLGELKASRVNGAPGVGTVVIQAYGADGALDSDAAGAIRVVILTPQI